MTLFNETRAYQQLKEHAQQAKTWKLTDLFSKDPTRFGRFSLSASGLFFDYSKNSISDETLSLLIALARECQLEQKRESLFNGDKYNNTEHRAVLHTALRAPRNNEVFFENQNVMPDVHRVLDKIEAFTQKIHSGSWTGFSGKKITDIINIGIGGSDLGPKMACQALRVFQKKDLTVHFVSNVDGHDLDATLQKLNPETSLFIVASKTFTTLETMLNANTAKNWFLNHASAADLPKHFVAISTNEEAVKAFGILPENMFPFWDWVGGRYSVWSAIGLSVSLAIGYDHFTEFLAGAHAMDTHFRYAPLEGNMPVLLALIGIWNRNFLNYPSVSIAPYLQDLDYFASYLQQLEMESNGKKVTKDGKPISWETSPIIWGNIGTNAQHAYFQLLHQGTDIVPVDFIVALQPAHDLPYHHDALLANCFAQSEALMKGKTEKEVREDLEKLGLSEEEKKFQMPHRTFVGNRPSNTILMNKIRPEFLGALVALYEHKTFVQGAIWNVNSFDQWGVELGKVLAKTIQQELKEDLTFEHDSSTAGLIRLAKAARN